jgi:hypothetical protein
MAKITIVSIRIMSPATVLLLSFRCGAPFRVLFVIVLFLLKRKKGCVGMIFGKRSGLN